MLAFGDNKCVAPCGMLPAAGALLTSQRYWLVCECDRRYGQLGVGDIITRPYPTELRVRINSWL